MITVDARESAIFEEIFDRGAAYSKTQLYLNEIESMLLRGKLEFDGNKLEDLATSTEEEITIFYQDLADASDRQAFLNAWSIGMRL